MLFSSLGSGPAGQRLPLYISSIHIPVWKYVGLKAMLQLLSLHCVTDTTNRCRVVCSCSFNVPFKSCRVDFKPLCQRSAASKLVTVSEGSIEKFSSVSHPTVKWRIIIACMMLTHRVQTCYMDQADNFLQAVSITSWIICLPTSVLPVYFQAQHARIGHCHITGSISLLVKLFFIWANDLCVSLHWSPGRRNAVCPVRKREIRQGETAECWSDCKSFFV